MSRFYTYLNTAVKIVHQYAGDIPLSSWLKDFYRQRKQMGSKDRKQVSELVYSYYRLGNSLPAYPAEDRMLAGLFLCQQTPRELLHYLKREWDEAIGLPLAEKQTLLKQKHPEFRPATIFPYQQELSAGIDPELFNQSFLYQPDLFLRIRPGHEKAVLTKLQGTGISYQHLNPACIALPNTTKIDQLFEPDQEVVIQDYNSQQTGQFFFGAHPPPSPVVWDCCAASGGKSIMAFDANPSIRLTVSDIRPSILHNLRQRFERAGILNYGSLLTDLSIPHPHLPSAEADLIIADAPCSGSGTWARTPEQLYFFQPEKILAYQELQKKIVHAAAKKLKKGGRMVYITCSVFRKENEEVVAYMQEQLGLQVETALVLKGYDMRADSMFAAVLSEPWFKTD
ncbi:MAG: RsmB/NOP family class I SAM-dependent RNA methyltransferase [Williamsia sp.]|nr:RsmB/NOP family class I SAM-dependent RNA methyltransferase [Williamsia sp.]